MIGGLEAYIAGLPGVQAAVASTNDKVYGKARASFASHDRPGGHRVRKGRLNAKDHVTWLEGPAPGAVEFGHFAGRGEGTRWVNGIHVLGRSSRGL